MGTKQSTHTPGPWKLYNNSTTEICAGENNEWVAETCFKLATGGVGHRKQDCYKKEAANARLIAAAPDLLVAIKFLIENVDALGINAMLDRDGRVTSLPNAVLNARAAIAKATNG